MMAGLQIKSLKETLNSMISWVTSNTSKLTDFTNGSVIKTILEAVSLQLDEFYYAIYNNCLYSIENAVYNAFGFPRKQGKNASGAVTLDFVKALDFPLTIPINTEFFTSKDARYFYVSTSTVVAAIGATTIDVPVQCAYIGTVGNIEENKIINMVTPMAIVSRIYNSRALTDGKDEETSADRNSRFIDYLNSLSKATNDALAYAASKVEGVKGVWVDPETRGKSVIYIQSSLGIDVSSDLLAAVKVSVEEYRAGGIEVVVLPVVAKPVDLDVEILLNPGYSRDTYYDLFLSATDSYFDTYKVSHNFYSSDIINFYKSINSLAILAVIVKQPTEPVYVAGKELITKGNITLSVKVGD